MCRQKGVRVLAMRKQGVGVIAAFVVVPLLQCSCLCSACFFFFFDASIVARSHGSWRTATNHAACSALHPVWSNSQQLPCLAQGWNDARQCDLYM